MFSHFFTRNWVRWTAIKYLQAHIARAVCVPVKTRPVVCLDQVVRSAPHKAPRPNGTKLPVRAHRAAAAPYERWDSETASYVPLRADEKVPEDRLHVSIKRRRPAAVRPNGGLRGSAATKWR